MTDLIKFAVDYGDGSFAYAPSVAGSQTRVLSAATAESTDVPQDADSRYAQKVVFSSDVDFWATPITSAEENLITNGTFDADTDWTKGAGWTIAAGVATATGAISTAIQQTQASGLLIPGRSYALSFTVTRSAGSLTPSIGGTNGSAVSTSTTSNQTIIAGATQVIAFTGSGFTGTLDAVTLTPIAVAPADNQTGGSPILNPVTWRLGGKFSKISLYSVDGGNVNLQYFA